MKIKIQITITIFYINVAGLRVELTPTKSPGRAELPSRRFKISLAR